MKYSTLIRASALYDLVLTTPFAIPGAAPGLLAAVSAANQAFGGPPIPAPDPTAELLARLLGSIVTVWAALRLWRPRWEFGAADAAARGLFTLQFGVLAASGGVPAVWLLLVPEALWGLAQGRGAVVFRKDDLPHP